MNVNAEKTSLKNPSRDRQFNQLRPSDTVRKQKKNILEDLFRSELSQFKKNCPSKNLKFDNLGIFRSLKLRILVEKVLAISPNLNFTPNTSGLLWVNPKTHHAEASLTCVFGLHEYHFLKKVLEG